MADLAAAGPGRTTIYTTELGAAICEAIADGQSLRTICAREDMPSKGTILRWVVNVEEFARLYHEARIMAAEAIADEIIEIADESDHDWRTNSQGERVIDREAVGRSKIRVDARKWALAKLLPKKYGAGVDAAPVPGATPDAPLHVRPALTVEQREAMTAALVAKAAMRAQRDAE